MEVTVASRKRSEFIDAEEAVERQERNPVEKWGT
jgi:hypothetical protein